MPFSPTRFKRLCDLKGVTQTALAARINVAQSQISECLRGIGPSVDLLEKLATGLDCTTDFLLARGSPAVDESNDLFRAVTSRMAYDVFAGRLNVTTEQRRRCSRVLGHPDAPITADAWAILAAHIDLALGPDTTGFRVITGGGA